MFTVEDGDLVCAMRAHDLLHLHHHSVVSGGTLEDAD
jgi:hypothetical protein